TGQRGCVVDAEHAGQRALGSRDRHHGACGAARTRSVGAGAGSGWSRGRRAPRRRVTGTVTSSGARGALERLWTDQRVAMAAAIALPVLWALVAGWWTPRGPLTTREVLAAMVVGLA